MPNSITEKGVKSWNTNPFYHLFEELCSGVIHHSVCIPEFLIHSLRAIFLLRKGKVSYEIFQFLLEMSTAYQITSRFMISTKLLALLTLVRECTTPILELRLYHNIILLENFVFYHDNFVGYFCKALGNISLNIHYGAPYQPLWKAEYSSRHL